jgi:hypothetical protein
MTKMHFLLKRIQKRLAQILMSGNLSIRRGHGVAEKASRLKPGSANCKKSVVIELLGSPTIFGMRINKN